MSEVEKVEQLGPLPDPWRPQGNIIQVQVQPQITREQVHEAIDRILTLSGCRSCGLLGFDIHLLGGDPAIRQLQDIQGVEKVQIVPRVTSPQG